VVRRRINRIVKGDLNGRTAWQSGSSGPVKKVRRYAAHGGQPPAVVYFNGIETGQHAQDCPEPRREPKMSMNGAESIVRSLIGAGVDTCFANPGTSEMHFVSALDRVPGIRCVLCLFEGVVTGAADGYGRMAGKPAATLLHCGPGLAYGLANLHNARRGTAPIVNIVGDQASYHHALDPPLASDAEGWARGVSVWTRTATDSATVARDVVAAIQAAQSDGGQVATLIAPADTCWNEGGQIAAPLHVPARTVVPAHRIVEIARLLRRKSGVLLILGGDALFGQGLNDAQRIAETTGAHIIAAQFNARVARGQGRVPIRRIPYAVTAAIEVLKPYDDVVLVGGALPVAPFAYPDKPGVLIREDAQLHVLARPEMDLNRALADLADELAAGPLALPQGAGFHGPASGAIVPEAVIQSLGALLPDGAVVSDESVSYGRDFFHGLAGAAPHDWLQNTGAAIGIGLPMATGAAIGAPGRRVVALQADGSAMLTLQALWTQARERLDVTTVILSNRRYQILIGELANVGAQSGPVSMDMFSLRNPDLDWTALARGMGVEAARAETMDAFNALFAAANGRPGPFLIELMV
jgi:acetolactate synthase-1/2/3 large subunit